jgi:DNA-binding transcriptional MocR family regulator
VQPVPRLYGDPPVSPRLGRLAAERLAADGISPDHLAVAGGALDGVERVLGAWLRPGDRVGVEDPGYPPVLDLLSAMDLTALPMALDEGGVTPAALQGALARGCRAVLLTPRAQAPTGAALDPERTRELAALLARSPEAGVIEDDHAGPVSGAAAHSVAGIGGARRWATIRSVSKSLGPDLRLAVLAGDEVTVSRVEGRQALGTGWVSGVLQAMVAELWSDRAVGRLMDRAAAAYAQRRGYLIDALAGRGVRATGRSGLAVWVPVADEPAVTGALLERGWAVAPGERFRVASPPGIRIGTGTLSRDEASRLAADIAGCLAVRPRRSD